MAVRASLRRALPRVRGEITSSRTLTVAVVILILVGTLGAVFGGPALGDDEAIVASVPAICGCRVIGWCRSYLGTPWFRKPPLPYWVIAAVSYVLPNDAGVDLPVSPLAARKRLHWAVCIRAPAVGHRSGMFSPPGILKRAVVGGSSLVFLLYGANATAEMLLTVCCTWAYFHFWFAATAESRGRGFSMRCSSMSPWAFGHVGQGACPIAVTALPLVVWWYTQRALLRLADEGRGGMARSDWSVFVRDLVAPNDSGIHRAVAHARPDRLRSDLHSVDAGGRRKVSARVEPVELAVLAAGTGKLRRYAGTRCLLLHTHRRRTRHP